MVHIAFSYCFHHSDELVFDLSATNPQLKPSQVDESAAVSD